MISQNWEAGTVCPECGQEIAVGADMLYGRHPGCARRGDTTDDPVAAASAILEAGGRVALAKKHLRALALSAALNAGFQPVRHPDRGQRGVRWYARIPGWTAKRVDDGLSTPEICGMWLDALDIGRTPPVSHDHLRAVLAAAGAPAPGRMENLTPGEECDEPARSAAAGSPGSQDRP